MPMTTRMPLQLPDAEALCAALADAMRAHVDPAATALVGIHTGGVWVAALAACRAGPENPAWLDGCVLLSR